MKRVCVTGAGGFIGHHLVTFLKERGYWVRGVDLKYPEYTEMDADEFELLDLPPVGRGLQATRGVDQVYALAADMGGMGFISTHHAEILHNNVAHQPAHARGRADQRRAAVPLHLLGLHLSRVPADRDRRGAAEGGATPTRPQPQDAYGWEKLFTERLCAYYADEYAMETRIVRFHNIYGPFGTYDGGREKAPAALCRKVALAEDGGSIEIWGDGEQTRSFCYIDDCVEGIYRIMQSDYAEPLNLGTDDMVSINELAASSSRWPASGTSAWSTYRVRRACGDATPTTRCCARSSDGNRRLPPRRARPHLSMDREAGDGGVTTPDHHGPPATDGPPRVDVLGVRISCLTLDSAVEEVSSWVDRAEHRYVCVTGVHGVMECRRDRNCVRSTTGPA